MLFQGGALFDSLRVWENVAFGLIQGRGMAAATGASEIALQKLARGRPRARRSASCARPSCRAACRSAWRWRAPSPPSPRSSFFDEPTTGLDPIMADVINELIVKCVRDLGATAISITHDMASARKIADRIAMIYKGKIIWQGRRPRSTSPATPLSTSSSTAAPKARSRWRSARCDRGS